MKIHLSAEAFNCQL